MVSFLLLIVVCVTQETVARQETENPRYVNESMTQDDGLEQVAKLEAQARKLLYEDGNYDQALVAYQRVLEIKERSVGKDSVGLSLTLMNIALSYRAKADYSNAEDTYRRVLSLQENALAETGAEVGRILERYACLVRRIGRTDQADNLSARASSILFKSKKPAGPVTGTVVNGSRISVPKPPYPKYVRKQRISGSVVVRITIGEDGKVINACAVDGPSALAQVSEDAALRALFTPTTLDGIPVKVAGVISYDFRR